MRFIGLDITINIIKIGSTGSCQSSFQNWESGTTAKLSEEIGGLKIIQSLESHVGSF